MSDDQVESPIDDSDNDKDYRQPTASNSSDTEYEENTIITPQLSEDNASIPSKPVNQLVAVGETQIPVQITEREKVGVKRLTREEKINKEKNKHKMRDICGG